MKLLIGAGAALSICIFCVFALLSLHGRDENGRTVGLRQGDKIPDYANTRDIRRGNCGLTFVTEDTVGEVVAFYTSRGFDMSALEYDSPGGEAYGYSSGFYRPASSGETEFVPDAYFRARPGSDGTGTSIVEFYVTPCCEGF